MLFCQPSRTFSCSRVLLFPCSPHRTMVKNVVKTRTSKTKCGYQKIGQSIRAALAATRGKAEEQNTMWSARSNQPKYVVNKNQNRVVKPCGQKPLRAGKNKPISRVFLLPPVSYCNLESELCQGLKSSFPLPK